MVLAEIPENVIFIVVMLAIAAFKALSEKFANKGQDETHQEYDEYDSVETDYDEYARQLRERQAEILARQQGQEQAPPPLPSTQPVRSQPSPKPQAPEITPYSPASLKKPQLTAAEQQALENLQDSSRLHQKRNRTGSTARARARRVLASPYAARDAIVLSEILGPPKGQRM